MVDHPASMVPLTALLPVPTVAHPTVLLNPMVDAPMVVPADPTVPPSLSPLDAHPLHLLLTVPPSSPPASVLATVSLVPASPMDLREAMVAVLTVPSHLTATLTEDPAFPSVEDPPDMVDAPMVPQATESPSPTA